MTDKLYLSHILRMAKQVLEAPVAQEVPLVLVCHSLGYLVNLAPQGCLVARAPTLLWVPEMCEEGAVDCFGTFFLSQR